MFNARSKLAIAVTGSLALLCQQVSAQAYPPQLLFVGLSSGQWKLFVGAGSQLVTVDTSSEPRTPAFAFEHKRVAYISAAGELRELDLSQKRDTLLMAPSADAAYTQPVYRPGTVDLYLVALKQGTSVDTDIVHFDRATAKMQPVLRQRSAQFEPTFSSDGQQLIYSHVACASECANIIQEVWGMRLSSGTVEQLTLLNAISRQPALAASGTLTFSSNQAGHFQLWQRSKPGKLTQLTQSQAVDEAPVTGEAGEIYFIRREASGGRLMLRAPGGQLRALELPDISDIRDLRWGR